MRTSLVPSRSVARSIMSSPTTRPLSERLRNGNSGQGASHVRHFSNSLLPRLAARSFALGNSLVIALWAADNEDSETARSITHHPSSSQERCCSEVTTLLTVDRSATFGEEGAQQFCCIVREDAARDRHLVVEAWIGAQLV